VTAVGINTLLIYSYVSTEMRNYCVNVVNMLPALCNVFLTYSYVVTTKLFLRYTLSFRAASKPEPQTH